MFFYNVFRKSNGIKYTLFFILIVSFGGSSISAFAGADLTSKVYKEPINLVSTTVDIAPTISAPTIVLSSSVSNLKAGETATITFTLSESASDFVVGDITVSGGTLSSFIGSGKNYTVVFTPDANSIADGVISVGSSKFSDVGGDFNADGGDSNNTATITVDTIVPTITGVSATTNNGSYKQSDVIAITVGFNDVVNVTGIPQLTLETGSSDAVVNYSSGTGSSTLTFNYTIGSGETSSKLDYQATNSLELPASNPGTPVYENTSGVGVRAAIRGDYAYLADNGSGLAIINIADPTNPGTPAYVNTTGYARYVVISGNYAYVADEASGLAIIDIQNPASPGTPSYVSTSGKVWGLAISGNYAYLAVSSDGLAIIDISDPTNPGAPVYENTTGYAYGVAISGSHAYVAVSSSGLAVIDISDPTNPGSPIYENTNGSSNKVAIKGNYAYVADGGSGLAIIDISDPTNPGTPVYENTTDARGIAISGDYAYVADYGSGLAVIDISDPTNPGTPVYESMSQNALGVTISGNYAYVGASTAGLAIIPTNVNTISDVSGNAATLTLASPGATNSLGVNKDLIVDTTVPADFTVGSVITTGGTVTAGKWNSTNTGINVTVPLADDATLIGGTLQIQASVASGSYENLGGAHTIADGEENTNVTSSFSASTFEALSGGISDGESILFKAILTDKAGNSTTGTASGTGITVDTVLPTLVSAITGDNNSDGTVDRLVLTFSEQVDLTSVDNNNFTLTESTGGSSLAISGSYSSSDQTTVTLTLTGVTANNTSLTISPNYDDGTGTIKDNAGNEMSFSEDVAGTDGVAPTINAIATSAFSWGSHLNATEDNSDGTVTVTTGGVENSQDVTITLNGQAYTGSVSSNSATVTITASALQALSEGSETLTADVSDVAGNAAAQVTSASFTVDTVLPTLVSAITGDNNSDGTVDRLVLTFSEQVDLTSVDNNNFTLTESTGGSSLAISGSYSSSDQTTVTLTLTGVTANNTSLTISPNYDDGTGTIKDNAGNEMSFSEDVAGTDGVAPTINAIATSAFSWGSHLNATEDNSDGTVTVTTSGVENSQDVTITLNGQAYTGSVSSNSATVTITASALQALTDGNTYSLTADVSDVAGNAAAQVTSASFTVDTTLPTINAIATSAFSWGSHLNATEDNSDGTVTVTTGGVENSQDVTITLNGQAYTGSVSSNSATVTITASALQALTDGNTYSLTADVSDVAGNAAAQVTSASFTVDTTLPTINAIATSAFSWGSHLNATEDNSDGTVTVTTGGVENSQDVTITLNGQAYTGSVSSNSATVTITASALQALSEGSETLTADVSDVAGNAAAQVTSASFTVDTVLPTLVSAITGDNNSDGTVDRLVLTFSEQVDLTSVDNNNFTLTESTGGSSLAISGSYSSSDQTTVTLTLTGVTANNTSLTISPNYDDGTGTIKDNAGNEMSFSEDVAGTDGVAPTINAIATSAFSWGSHLNATEDNSDGTVTVTTSGVENSQDVTITLNGQAYTGSVSSNSATVTITASALQALTDGNTYSLTADVSDVAGNAAAQVTSASFTVDTTLPTINAIATSAFSWGSHLNATEDNSDGTVTVTTGGVENSQDVTITLNGQAYTGSVSSNSATVTITASALQALTDGNTYSLTADVSDVAGNAAAQVTSASFTVDTTLPTINAIATSAFSWGSHLNATEDNSDGTVTVTTGGVENSQDVTITLNGQAYTGSVSSNSATVTITASALQALSEGSETLTADVSDVAGNAAAQVTSASFTVDTVLPTLVSAITGDNNSDGTVDRLVLTFSEQVDLTSVDNNNFTLTESTGGSSLAISGSYSSSDQTTVTLTLTGVTANNTSLTISPNYDDGTGTIKDNAGNEMSFSEDVAGTDGVAPTINAIATSAFSWGSHLNATEDNSDGTVTVTTSGVENSQDVTITLNGQAYTGSVSSNSATVTITASALQALTDGNTYSLTADVSDVAGNAAAQVTSASFTVDTTLPTINAIATSAFSWGSHLNATEDNSDGTVTVTTGGVENSQDVTITLNGQAYTGSVSSNSATVTITASALQALTDGNTYSLTADVSDVAGNAAAQVTSASFTVDTTLPTINAIATSAFSWGSHLNATEDNSDGTVTVTTGGVENSQDVTITLNGQAYTGSVSSNSATVTITASALQALSEGSETLTADVSDVAGNAAAQVTSSSFTVDRTATISAIATSAFSWGSHLNATEDNSDGTVTVTTSGVENSQDVTITLNGQAYTGSVSSNSATVTITASALQALTDGNTYSLTADVSDVAGNAAAQVTSASFTVDTTLPTINAIATSAFSWGSHLNATEDNSDGTVTVTTGGVENSQDVTITLNGQAYTGSVSSNSATVTITASALQALTDGNTYSLTADVSDVAGNAAAQVTSASFTVDTTLPTINAIATSAFSWGSHLNATEDNSDGTVTVTTGGVENSQDVTITLNGQAYTGSVSSNSATVTITASALQALIRGEDVVFNSGC